MKNKNVWDEFKKQYADPNLDNEKRLLLAKLFNNASQSNYNIENIINNDPQGMKLILDKMINHPVESLDDGGRDIAETEVDTLCNILKDNNNYKALAKGKIITDDMIEALYSLYKNLDEKIGEPLLPILAQIREADKSKKEKDQVDEDSKKIAELEQRVGNCFENHKKALLKLSGAKKIQGELGDEAGKLKNKQDGKGGAGDLDFMKNASSMKKMSLTSGALLMLDLSNVKSSLSTLENPEMSQDLDKILFLLRKNYNDMKLSEEPQLNVRRADNVNKCLVMLKKISSSPDNHKPILEGGFMNFMELLDTDYKLFKEDNRPNLDDQKLGFDVNGKNVLQACSNSESSIPIISQSPVFDSTIDEVMKLYDKPQLIASSNLIEQLFLYDNVIFSNLCKDKNAFDEIFNKMGLNDLLALGQKTGNINLLEAIINMLRNYIENAENLDEIPKQVLEPTFDILKKCSQLNDRTPTLMSKVLGLGTMLYNNEKLRQRVDGLDLIHSMNADMDKFSGDHDYLNACLGLLSQLTLNNPMNGQEALNCGLIQKINAAASTIIRNGPEKYGHDDGAKAYLRTCLNLSELYNSLVRNDMNNVDKFNNMGITDNTINMLKVFNEEVQPRTEEEKESDLRRVRAVRGKPLYNKENLGPDDMVRCIMKNCGEIMEQITIPPTSNDFLSNKTNFADTITTTLGNQNNDSDYLIIALNALSNYLFDEYGKNYSKLDLPKVYDLLKNLQQKYYSNAEILSKVNCIAGALVKNLKDDPKQREFVKRFYNLISESTKLQDYNQDLVNMALKLMYDGLVKKPYLVDEMYEETVPPVMNLLQLYKDNPEIQENGYKILSLFAKNAAFASSMLNNGLLDVIKFTLDNPLFSEELKESAKGLRGEIYRLLNLLATDVENCPKIADELMGNLIACINEKGYNEEGKDIVSLLDVLLQNIKCVPPFVLNNGIDACIKLLNENDTNIDLISKIFNILKNVANVSDEYKKMLQEKKVPDLINRIIKKAGVYDKRIEFEGRQLLFNVNLVKIQLEDPNSILVDDIKIAEPIPPEVRNFLTSGKQVKIINNNGDVKQMQLIFSPDLMKVSAKKIKSNLPPKPKYIIETPTIKKILKGHGTDAFKKSKTLFRKIPPPEICFSIIGPTSVEGVKSLNVQCETEKEVDKWIKYLQIVINYFKKTHTIKGTVIVKK